MFPTLKPSKVVLLAPASLLPVMEESPRRSPTLSFMVGQLVFLWNGMLLPRFFVLLSNWLGVLQNPKSKFSLDAASRATLASRRPLLPGTLP